MRHGRRSWSSYHCICSQEDQGSCSACFLHLIQPRTPARGCAASHSQGGSSLLSQTFLKTIIGTSRGIFPWWFWIISNGQWRSTSTKCLSKRSNFNHTIYTLVNQIYFLLSFFLSFFSVISFPPRDRIAMYSEIFSNLGSQYVSWCQALLWELCCWMMTLMSIQKYDQILQSSTQTHLSVSKIGTPV